MNKFSGQVLLSVLFLAGSAAMADSVVVPGHGTSIWQNWQTSSLDPQTSGSPFTHGAFWNNSSYDGSEKNVGWCMTSNHCGMTNPPGNMPYLGTSSGGYFQNFYFTSSGGGSVSMILQMAQNAPQDTIGWYNVQNTSQHGVIFSGLKAAGTTVTFDPSAEYGLYLIDAATSSAFMTDSLIAGNTDTGIQHFGVFQGSDGSFFVGAEDLPASLSDFDYNDLVIQIKSAGAVMTPEPGTMLLMASGLFGFGLMRLRKRNRG